MPCFSPYKETKIIVDANPVGIVGILVLDDQPIAYGSRALSDNESRYSKTEREALAVVLANPNPKRFLTHGSYWL